MDDGEFEDEVESGGVVMDTSTEETKPACLQCGFLSDFTAFVQNRFIDEVTREELRRYIVEMTLSYLNTHQENPRSLIKTCTAVASFKEIRVRSSELLEGMEVISLFDNPEWLTNPATTRFAKELLHRIVLLCSDSSPEDGATLTNLLKLKIKGMHAQLWTDAINQLLKNNKDYPIMGKPQHIRSLTFLALRHFIYYDLVGGKSPINPKIFITAYKSIPSMQPATFL